MHIISLNNIDAGNGSFAGKKAQNLGRLIKSGFKVPEGFCISSKAYDEHIKKIGLGELIEKIPENKKEILSQIRENIIQKPLDESLSNEIKCHFSSIQIPLAVRSSGTAEDMENCSFAGQYDTFLHIQHYEDCLMAVKKCWASMWNERVYEYREKYGIAHSASMSVIIQNMIKGDFSGVIFTEDPRGKKDNIIIEYSMGTGDNLVSGSITPERIILNKKNPEIESNNRMIDKNTLKILADYSLKIEELFKSPQDIEWTLEGKEIYFLQARPITTNKKPKYIWTNANAGEVLPDVACPMTWSMVKLIINHIFQPFGIDPEKTELIGLIAGRAYFNLNAMEGILKKFPGFKKETFNEMLGGMQEKIPEISEDSIPEININILQIIIKFMNLFVLSIFKRPSKAIKHINSLKEHTLELMKTDITTFSDEKLFSHFNSLFKEMDNKTELIMAGGSGMNYFFLLKHLAKKWLGDNDTSIANKLITGIGGMDSAESGIHMRELAIRACKNMKTKEIILSGKTFNEIKNSLSETDEGKEFLLLWDKFMEHHGHHTRGEIDVMNPRWFEMPDYILKQVVAYVKEYGKIDYNENSKERKELISQIQLKLNPLKRLIFNYILYQCEKGLLCRENLKSNMIRYIAAIRLTLLELEKRLIKKGILKNKNDIFFIDLDELYSLSEGKEDVNLINLINERRKEYEKNLNLSPPPVVIGEFDPENYIPAEIQIRTELKGFPVSPGIVSGKARVILRSDMEETIEPGEILVAPFTDPGWTPYFISAKAIVMDMGGMLSHGSIVARELGIPAVVNVGMATKIIKTGDKIQVDGNSGVVMIMSEK